MLLERYVYNTKYIHRHLQARAYPGIARVISNHGYSYRENRRTRRLPIAYACLRTHKRTYSIQCSDKIRLRSKCGVAKSCPGTHTALQAPMSMFYLLSSYRLLYLHYICCYTVRKSCFFQIPESLSQVLAQAKNPEFEAATRCEAGIRVLSLSI